MNQPAPTGVYLPIGSAPPRSMAFVVRTGRVGTAGLLRELEHAVRSVNSNVPLGNVRTLEQIQANSMVQTSFAMIMLGIAAGVALLLALVGVYGVVAYIATQRTHEVGIRMALGAHTRAVRRLFLRHGAALAAGWSRRRARRSRAAHADDERAVVRCPSGGPADLCRRVDRTGGRHPDGRIPSSSPCLTRATDHRVAVGNVKRHLRARR